jgi:O-glycosyl hydrolase
MKVFQIILAASPLSLALSLYPRANTVTLDSSISYQTITGFGVSQAFGHAEQLYNLATPLQKQVLDMLFSTSTGAGLTILRNIITTGKIEPTSPGSPDATPAYVWDGSDGAQVWLSQQAAAYGVKTIYANAWSAPSFMKTNSAVANGGYLCGVTGQTCSSGSWIQAYTNYLTQYVQDYQKSGVNISHVGFLNEPDSSFSYDSMLSNGQQAADVIRVLRTTLDAAGFTSVKINCCDNQGWNTSSAVLKDVQAAGGTSHLGAVTSHGYTTAPGLPFSFTSLPVWQTEWADLNHPWSTSWAANGTAVDGLVWAQRIQSGLVNSNLSAFLYWIGAEPTSASSSAMLVQWSSTSVTASGRLWAFAHFGRFVRPGAVRISATSSTSTLKVSAFKNTDGTLSLQVINPGSSDVKVFLIYGED